MSESNEVTDIVVVGSGAGGAVIAKELGESGLSVKVLEAGRRYSPNDYLTHKQTFEVDAPGVLQVDCARDATSSTRPFWYSRMKGVGGSTLHYQGVSPRMHESDFATKTRDGVGEDWPITYADLEPFYSRVEFELGIAGPTGPEANPFEPYRSARYPTPPHPFDKGTQAIDRGAKRLGLHPSPVPIAVPTKNWNGRRACISSGVCEMGCRIGAKSSMDVTYIPKAERTGRVSISPNSMAIQVTVDDNRRASGVVYLDGEGVERRAKAKAVVLAGNAVETPRLLLLSTSPQFPQGLANSSGLVGRYFTEHLAVFANGVFPDRLESWRGIPVKAIIQDFYETRPSAGFARGWTTLTEAMSVRPLVTAHSISGWGVEHKKRMSELFGHTIGLSTVGEQLPELNNRITLDPFRKDPFGLPIPRISSRLGENDRAMVKAIPQILDDILRASGATQVVHSPFKPGLSSHYLGTCRMGTDPKSSVVDPWCRTHDVRNLFIGDGSVFVTGGSVNPALTISAIATRTAAGILEAFASDDL